VTGEVVHRNLLVAVRASSLLPQMNALQKKQQVEFSIQYSDYFQTERVLVVMTGEQCSGSGWICKKYLDPYYVWYFITDSKKF
jgi:hypothetical protein